MRTKKLATGFAVLAAALCTIFMQRKYLGKPLLQIEDSSSIFPDVPVKIDSNSRLLVSLVISHYNKCEVMGLWKQRICF